MRTVQQRDNPSGAPLRLLTVGGVLEANPGITEWTLRGWIRRAEENGLDKHICRKGRRVYIDINGFQQWIRG